MSQQQSSIEANKHDKCDGCGKEECADLILKSCSACHSVKYCSSACQLASWAGHKKACKQIRLRMEKGGGGVGDMGSLLVALSSVKRYSEMEVYNACVDGKKEVLQKMLKQSGLDVNWAEPQTGWTAVHLAAAQGHDKCLLMLIQYGGADLSKTNKSGSAPIHVACNHGRIACLILILDNGAYADLPTADAYGITSAVLCCMSGHVKCLALLLDRGANPDLATKFGSTPIHKACYNGQYICLQLLIARGADFNARDPDGWTPLDVAKSRGHHECVELLLEKGAVGDSNVAILTQTEAEKVRQKRM
jgi:hypothetical protein